MTPSTEPVTQTKRDFRQEVTDSIVRMLEEGVAPWQKPWESTGIPLNPTTGNSYRGGNAIHLMATGIRRGFEDPRWTTYRQAAQNGWQVRKGEKGTQIEFWDVQPAEQRKEGGNGDGGADQAGRRLIHRVYTVFNAKQIDGIPPYTARRHSDFEVVQAGEQILVNSGARISHDQVDRAFYRPSTDSIHLPSKKSFKDAPGYYGTALHELAHWTGQQARLNRSTLTDTYRFGDTNYAREELRAELASVFLAAERGIPHDPRSHAAYVGSWIKALREDKNEIFRAAHDASAAADYLLALERNKALAETLEASPDSVEPEQQKAELDGESSKLRDDAELVTEAADRGAATGGTPGDNAGERESMRRTTRFEPGSATLLAHDKQNGDHRRTPVDVASGSPVQVTREDLRRSLSAAQDVTAKALGDNASTHTAVTDSGTYRGTIIGETDLHVVQRLSAGSAVAHLKHLLAPMPNTGENVVISYSQSRADVRDLRQRTKAQGLGR